DERGTDSYGGTACFQEVGDIVHVHAAGGHEAEVRKRGKQSFDIGGPQGIGGEELHEVRASLVGELRLGGGVGAEHDWAVSYLGDREELGAADGRHDELGTRRDGSPAGVGIQHG